MAHRTILSGGGINSSVLVSKHESTSAKPKSHGVSPAGVDQLGAKVATVKAYEPLYSGSAYPSKLGNELAGNVGKGGAGTGRTIYRPGTQAQHGEAVRSDRPQGRDILGAFGPDYKGRGSPR